MPFVQALDNQIADLVLGDGTYTKETTVFVGLSTTTPTKVGGNVTEPVANGYARVSVTNNLANWPDANASGLKSNGTVITFPVATGAGWGTVTHVVVYNASTAGTFMMYGLLTTPKLVSAGDTASLAIGAFDLQMGPAS
jgi:hypothetical protein